MHYTHGIINEKYVITERTTLKNKKKQKTVKDVGQLNYRLKLDKSHSIYIRK